LYNIIKGDWFYKKKNLMGGRKINVPLSEFAAAFIGAFRI
jgi:hypothetical protein